MIEFHLVGNIFISIFHLLLYFENAMAVWHKHDAIEIGFLR
jgi:hypothetical protein